MRDIILVACIKCKSYSIKTVGEDAVTIYLQLFQKFAKNISIIKKRTSRVANLVPNTCVKFESIPLKTVGGDRF